MSILSNIGNLFGGGRAVLTVTTIVSRVEALKSEVTAIKADADAIKAGHSEAISQLAQDIAAVEATVASLTQLG